MALDGQIVPIPFGQGLDTKTDPKQVNIGKLTTLVNARFQTNKEIKKRPGTTAFTQNILGGGAVAAGVGVASYNSELIELDGSKLYSYSTSTVDWANKGKLITTNLAVQSVIRNANSQTVADSAINGNFSCFVWYDSGGTGPTYAVVDTTSDQTLASGSIGNSLNPKVLAVGVYFVIIYYDPSDHKIYYRSISTATPTTLGTQTAIATDINTTAPIWDATVINNTIYVAYNSTTASRVSVYSLSSTLVLSSRFDAAGQAASQVLTVMGDASFNVWVVYKAAGNFFVFIENAALGAAVLAPTDLGISAASSFRLTGVVQSTTATMIVENEIAANIAVTRTFTVTSAGVASAVNVLTPYVALASKCFVYNSIVYVWVNFIGSSGGQPSYFLIDTSDNVIARLSPGTGGSVSRTTRTLLAEVNLVSAGVYQFASLVVDELSSVNGMIQTQSGVNSSTVTFSSVAPQKLVLGDNIHFAGGQLMMYDGKSVVEHGFEYYPETGFSAAPVVTYSGGGIGPGTSTSHTFSVEYEATYEWTDNQGQIHRSSPSNPVNVNFNAFTIITTVTQTNASNVLSAVTNFVGVGVGQTILVFGAGGAVARTITAFDATAMTITISSNATLTLTVSTLITPYAPVIHKGDLTINSKTITNLGSVSGFFVGQTLFVPTQEGPSFPVGTYITAIGTTTIDISEPAIVTSPSVDICTLDVVSIAIDVCPLTVSQKTGVSIVLYRTAVNGTVLYKSGTAVNLPTVTADITITDTTSDNVLIGNNELYTTGGEVDNIAIPACIALTSYQSRAMGVTVENPLGLWYSKQVIPGSPVEFSDLFVQNIDSRGGNPTAIASMDDKLIIFKQNYIFYMVGAGPAPSGDNNDFSPAILISSDVGCINPNSIVLFANGLMFQSNKGIYLLDRSLQTSYIGAEVEAYNSYTITSAQRVPNTTIVVFTLSNGTNLVYDFFYSQWDTDAPPAELIDSTIYNNQYTAVQANGLVVEESALYTDNAIAIPLSCETGWLNFASLQGFQRVRQLLIVGNYKSPHDLIVTIYNDFSDTPSQTTTIPVQTDPGVYQFRVFIDQQKCESIRFSLTDSNRSGSGESFSLSALSLEVGIKKGLNKLPASASFGS